jgi:Protein of unknown function (DUF1326)
VSYAVSGSYFESCNCDPICPCRMTDGIPGGRSTYGVCYGALAWLVEDGQVGEVDVTGLKVALTVMYDDDELGSPWTIVLHVDADGSEPQQVEVRVDPIELVPDGDGYNLNVGAAVRVSAVRPVESDAVVRCGIPGYDQPGRELVADELRIDDDPFAWELSGNCAYASRFAYASA